MSLTWKNNDSAASTYMHRMKSETEHTLQIPVANHTSINITDLSPATSYTLSIIPQVNGQVRNAVNITVTTSKLTGLQECHEPFLLVLCPRALSIQVVCWKEIGFH